MPTVLTGYAYSLNKDRILHQVCESKSKSSCKYIRAEIPVSLHWLRCYRNMTHENTISFCLISINPLVWFSCLICFMQSMFMLHKVSTTWLVKWLNLIEKWIRHRQAGISISCSKFVCFLTVHSGRERITGSTVALMCNNVCVYNLSYFT